MPSGREKGAETQKLNRKAAQEPKQLASQLLSGSRLELFIKLHAKRPFQVL